MTKSQRVELLLQLYPQGYSLREIAKRIGCAYEGVRRLAHTFDLELRPRGYQAQKRRAA